jgi:phage gpG-like protein
MVDIAFRGTSEDARRAIKQVFGQLTGKTPDHGGLARSVFYALGFQALSDVSEAFIVKSQGGTDEAGISWPPLSKKYLAYGRRFGRGEKAALKRDAGLGRQHHRGIGGNAGLLNAQQQKRWKHIFAKNLTWLAARYDIGTAKGIAAGMAWNQLKAEGAKTMLEVYGNRKVDILRDTGVLFNSISPGYFDGNDYEKPHREGGEQQVFTALADGIIVGTNVPYAGAHDKGSGVPKREIFPKAIPTVWMQRLADVGMQAIAICMRRSLTGGAA